MEQPVQRAEEQPLVRALDFKTAVIGAIGAAAACVVVSYAELVLKQIQIGMCQFAPAGIGLLLVVVGVNAAVHRASRKLGLTPAQLVIVYCMIVVGALLNSRGLMEKWFSTLVAINYLAKPENKWAETFFPHLPQWAMPFNVHGPAGQDVTKYFYEGLRGGHAIPWSLWITPILTWLILIAAVFSIFLAMACLLRRQWVDNERLTFPLVELPLEVMREDRAGDFFRNKLTWIGFSIPVFVFTLNGLHANYPFIPQIAVQYNLNPYFTQTPWNQLSMITVYISFAAVGFSYFLPTQLLFSLWFFFLFTRLQDLVFAMLGIPQNIMPLYPTREPMGYQVAGAYTVLTFFMVRAGWPHFKAVLSRAFRGDPTVDDSRELMSYRAAVMTILIGFLVCIGWSVAAGLALWLAVVEWGVYLFFTALVMSRSVAEGGLMMTETSFRPVDLVRMFTSKASLGVQNLTVLSLFDAVFVRDLRGLLVTPVLDGLKMTDAVRLPRRQLLGGVVLAVFVAVGLGIVVHLYLPYHYGALQLYTYGYQGNAIWGFKDAMGALQNQEQFQIGRLGFYLTGCAFTLFLTSMRARFWWWPFYPLGYALSASWTMIVFWFPIMVAWVIKSTLLRYAGMKVYTAARPFFLGLIMGEFLMAVFWTIFSMITRHPVPQFPWS